MAKRRRVGGEFQRTIYYQASATSLRAVIHDLNARSRSRCRSWRVDILTTDREVLLRTAEGSLSGRPPTYFSKHCTVPFDENNLPPFRESFYPVIPDFASLIFKLHCDSRSVVTHQSLFSCTKGRIWSRRADLRNAESYSAAPHKLFRQEIHAKEYCSKGDYVDAPEEPQDLICSEAVRGGSSPPPACSPHQARKHGASSTQPELEASFTDQQREI